MIVRFIPPKHFWQRPKIELMESMTVCGWSIPAGHISDGATVPRILWPVIHPWGRWTHAAILHDYLLTILPRWEADREFRLALVRTGTRTPLAWVMWAAVRVYGLSRSTLL